MWVDRTEVSGDSGSVHRCGAIQSHLVGWRWVIISWKGHSSTYMAGGRVVGVSVQPSAVSRSSQKLVARNEGKTGNRGSEWGKRGRGRPILGFPGGTLGSCMPSQAV